LSYGLSDVLGGLAARRLGAVRAALLGQLGGLIVTGFAAWLAPGSASLAGLGWGGLSGVGTGLAMAFLFRGMARGAMSVVVPISAVVGVALPVVIGAVLLTDRPHWLTWVGVVVALPSLWMISRPSDSAARPTAASVRDGLVASVGIAVQYLALAQSGPTGGLWPVFAGRVTALLVILVLAATPRHRRRVPADRVSLGSERPGGHWRHTAMAIGAGVLAATALSAYLGATRTGHVTAAVVLSSLYPVVPVCFGVAALGERLRHRQLWGLFGTLAAAVLISVT
jgi:uncharacterized membrane protein